MSTQSSLSLPGGQAGLSTSSLSASSQLYSDEDIGLIHSIVALGEAIYPTLPERERLPTNALFIAAETILPQHGYDPDNVPSHISRLIFKIGGQRAGETLSDKFQTVLAGMGIQLEFVSSSPTSGPPSAASFALSDDPIDEPTERLSLSDDDITYDLPVRRRPYPYPSQPGFNEERAESTSEPIAHLIHSSPRSDDEVNTIRRASDATASADDEQVARFLHHEHREVDTQALEAKLEQIRMRDAEQAMKEVLGTWHLAAKETQYKNTQFRAFAVEYDKDALVGEVVDIWYEEALAAQQRRIAAERAAEAAAEHAAYVARMEKRASRVYEIYMARNVLSQWQEQAREEVDRTAVARRHLVRKRAFESWHTQHVQDESKVRNFILLNALQKWGQVALHHEVREQVAVHWHEQNLRKEALGTMLEVSKERLADDVYLCGLAEDCLNTWSAKARETADEYQVAAELDNRLLLDEALNIWLQELDELEYNARACTHQFLVQDCRKKLDAWQEQARLSALLKQWNAKEEEDAKIDVLHTWHTALAEARLSTALADTFMVKESADHWERETKLKLYIQHDEEETKRAVFTHWALEEKLAWYTQYDEKKTKIWVLDTFLSASRQAESKRLRHEQEADHVQHYYTKTEAMETWATETEKMWIQRQNADLVCLYRTIKPCMDHWRVRCEEKTAHDAYYRRKADRHRARAMVSDVLDEWPAIAENARRARMMNKLRQFRRQYKVDLARSCLDTWLSATAEAVEAGRDARRVNIHYKREDINDCLDSWRDTAQRAQKIQQIAADAELEVYCGKWQGRLHEEQENMQDAIDYDAEKTRAHCWAKWEFQTLQHESKRNMAATVQEKNDRRMCFQILDAWQQKAVPEAAAARTDLRLSTTVSRRSIRQQLAARSWVPGYTASQLATFSTATTAATGRSSSLRLGPMAEFDEESFAPDTESNDPGFMSTPTKWTGSARPLGYRPSSTTTPSAVLPSPYERELRQRYGVVGTGARSRMLGFADITEEDTGQDLYA